ncbi:O-antigen ligase family protein [Legionella maioricensis]|uniref:O-antigen ligase family protein n=1 Tax=Legionella maioricensis TaxID=2896528 RepID=UPI003D6CAEE9
MRGKGIFLAPIFFVLFIFFLPISPSVKSIFLICSIVSILFTPYYSKHLFYAFNTLWGRAALGLFVFVLIACLWSDAPSSMQWMVVGKYLKVLYLPILAVGFIHPRIRNLSINSYLAAIVFTCIISILKSKSIFLVGDPGEVFYNRIITGFMVSFGAYLAGLFAFQHQGWGRVSYILLVLLTSYQVLCINTGRTGYIVYFILMTLLLLQKISFKKAVPGIFLLCGLMLAVYYVSPIMQERVNDLLSDIKLSQHHTENSSLGYRVQFHHYAKSLFATHPVIGIGTGGFKYSFSKDNPVPAWGKELNDPHSQYWLTLSEQGVVGLLLLLFFLGSLFISSFQLTETRPILLGILVSFSASALADTILCYSTLGFILVVMSALSLGELIEQRALKNAKESEFSSSPNGHFIDVIHTG